jgi:uncharacterized protein YndB with AHSA1/START domain
MTEPAPAATAPTSDTSDVSTTSTDITAPPDRVFNVLLDPTTYPEWLRGAKHIRSVDDTWPEPGSAFHHVVGAGPLVIADKTEVVSHERPRRVELRAAARPTGVASVVFTLDATATGTQVTISERPCGGPIRLLWEHGARPALEPLLRARNADSLRLLTDLIERG